VSQTGIIRYPKKVPLTEWRGDTKKVLMEINTDLNELPRNREHSHGRWPKQGVKDKQGRWDQRRGARRELMVMGTRKRNRGRDWKGKSGGIFLKGARRIRRKSARGGRGKGNERGEKWS